MYISKVRIENFRNFKNTQIEFNDGVNVIIGHNNAGKSNLIKALGLVLSSQAGKQLDLDDFNKLASLEELRADPPRIRISLFIRQSNNEDLNSDDDLATVGNWLISLNEPYEVLLTYEFFLPERERASYLQAISSATDLEVAWKILKHDYIRFYMYKIWGGDPIAQTLADSESLQKFDFQFLDAIRDVERDMLTGRNTLLRDVLHFFIDYEIKSDTTKPDDTKKAAIKKKQQEFSDQAKTLLAHLQARMEEGKEQILSYAKETGASFNKAVPNFEGSISELEMFSALKLILEHDNGMKIPATHNGLGYNNLIFMSFLLAKMQVNSNGKYLGSNAKVFPILVIEEPEAHLHPAMQYQFLRFLKKNKIEKKVRQIFVTTHSTHITSSVSLDEIICLHNEAKQTIVGYPGKVFIDNEKSKSYVQRFLDATKSDMLFAQRVIFVEGLAEQLLLSILARYEGKSLEESHVAVINVGGRYFEHFLYLFDSKKSHAINKKIVCLTDIDPERRSKIHDASFKKCYPFELNNDCTLYEYIINTSLSKYGENNHPNIVSFSQSSTEGKTFEYDLVLHNPSLELLITESMRNKEEITTLMNLYKYTKDISKYKKALRPSEENQRIVDGIESNTIWTNDQKCKAIIASRYLNSVAKGENALELAYSLEKNLTRKETPEYQEFVVPEYIRKAIEWICK